MSKKKEETVEKTEEVVANQLGERPEVLPISEEPVGDVEKHGKIEVGEPLDLRPKALPLVVKLPANASTAQQEYAKILNAYAYQNQKKWAVKKDNLIARLKMLEKEEVDVDPKTSMSIRGSKHSFRFIKMGKEGEIYARPESVATED